MLRASRLSGDALRRFGSGSLLRGLLATAKVTLRRALPERRIGAAAPEPKVAGISEIDIAAAVVAPSCHRQSLARRAHRPSALARRHNRRYRALEVARHLARLAG